MVLRDNEILYLDSMIDAYASITAYVERVPELEAKIAAACNAVCESEPEFDSFNAILGRAYPAKDQWTRQVAWISQHAFRNRAHCVGNKILLNRAGKNSSPLLDQLVLLGYEANTRALPEMSHICPDAADGLTQLDAMVVDRPSSRVFLVKGMTLNRATRPSGHRGEPLLFKRDESADDKLLVHRRYLKCLGAAYHLMRFAFTDTTFVPVILVLDSPDHCWSYRAFDVSGAMTGLKRLQPRVLSEYPLLVSSHDRDRAGDSSDLLRFLPKWGAHNPLRNLPVDRATRCLINMGIIWNKQRESHDRLATVSRAEFARVHRQSYEIEYTEDLLRHDLEDCLERGGLVERPAYEGSRFALTAKGLARFLLTRRLLDGRSEFEARDDVRTHLLNHIHDQARLWQRYRSGEAVCI